MTNDKLLREDLPRFYKEPSTEEVERIGRPAAEIQSRIRARIIGSRVLSSSVAVGIGTLITVQEYFRGGDVKPADWAANLVIPALVNGIAQFKIERQLQNTGQEITDILSAKSRTEQMPENDNRLEES